MTPGSVEEGMPMPTDPEAAHNTLVGIVRLTASAEAVAPAVARYISFEVDGLFRVRGRLLAAMAAQGLVLPDEAPMTDGTSLGELQGDGQAVAPALEPAGGDAVGHELPTLTESGLRVIQRGGQDMLALRREVLDIPALGVEVVKLAFERGHVSARDLLPILQADDPELDGDELSMIIDRLQAAWPGVLSPFLRIIATDDGDRVLNARAEAHEPWPQAPEAETALPRPEASIVDKSPVDEGEPEEPDAFTQALNSLTTVTDNPDRLSDDGLRNLLGDMTRLVAGLRAQPAHPAEPPPSPPEQMAPPAPEAVAEPPADAADELAETLPELIMPDGVLRVGEVKQSIQALGYIEQAILTTMAAHEGLVWSMAALERIITPMLPVEAARKDLVQRLVQSSVFAADLDQILYTYADPRRPDEPVWLFASSRGDAAFFWELYLEQEGLPVPSADETITDDGPLASAEETDTATADTDSTTSQEVSPYPKGAYPGDDNLWHFTDDEELTKWGVIIVDDQLVMRRKLGGGKMQDEPISRQRDFIAAFKLLVEGGESLSAEELVATLGALYPEVGDCPAIVTPTKNGRKIIKALRERLIDQLRVDSKLLSIGDRDSSLGILRSRPNE